MPHKCCQAYHGHRAFTQSIRLTIPLHQGHGYKAFKGIQHQGQNGGFFAARPQHVGRTRIFAAKSARVIQTHQLADDDGK